MQLGDRYILPRNDKLRGKTTFFIGKIGCHSMIKSAKQVKLQGMGYSLKSFSKL
jgi:hypothetical protein